MAHIKRTKNLTNEITQMEQIAGRRENENDTNSFALAPSVMNRSIEWFGDFIVITISLSGAPQNTWTWT